MKTSPVVLVAATPITTNGIRRPPIALIHVRNLIVAVPVVVAVIAGLLSLYRFQENWTEYRASAEALRQERFLYLTRTAPYAGDNAFTLLVGRVEDLLRSERSGWAEAMRAADEDEKDAPSAQAGDASAVEQE